MPGAAGSSLCSGPAPKIVHKALGGPARSLDPATRSVFEPGFGYDLSRVRIHTGALANESARAVNARAYTVGRDVVFADGQFAPRTNSGQRLLAHELAHVVQQRGISERPAKLSIGAQSDAKEIEAEGVANAFFAFGRLPKVANVDIGPGVLRRAPIHSGRILDEGTCADLVAGSKWICCDPGHGFERKGKKTDIEGTSCPSEKFTPTFTCDNTCSKALKHGCSDSDNWMAIPKSRFAGRKCDQDLVICANGKSTHAYVRDRSEREAWEVSRAIPKALGVPADFQASIYADASDPDYAKDKACHGTAAKTESKRSEAGATEYREGGRSVPSK